MTADDLTDVFDAITEQQLRDIGGLKWSAFPDSIGAFVAEMDFGVAPAISETLHSMVDLGFFGYPPAALGETMSRACADWQRERNGWDVPAERVRPIGDVLTALAVTIELFTKPGSAVVLPTPAYMPFLTVPGTLGREVIQVPMLETESGWAMDYDGIDRAFAAGGGLLILCNPHNPIGRVYTPDEMLRVSEIVERHGGRVFSDEIHAPLVYEGHRHVPYASLNETTAAHTITSTSASKAFNLPGLKCAQLIFSNEADAKTWSEYPRMFSVEHGASVPGLLANIAAYRDSRGWLDSVVAYLDGSRREMAALVAEHLPGVGYAMPEGTYLTLLDFRGQGLGDSPSEFFAEHAKVATTDGAMCGDAARGFLRFNLAMPRPILRIAIARMGEALRGR